MTTKALGDDTLRKMEELAGTECNGVVKVVSKLGDWLYVSPDIDEDEYCGSLNTGILSRSFCYRSRHRVRVRLEGVDEKRSQLSMSLLEKEE